MELIYKTENGRLFHEDNIEVMKKIKNNTVDSCISDFPYDLSFMGKKWDNTGNFYEWCKDRAEPLYRIIKPGGYVCIFGHPKTNHRMKSAFEDAGFNIVEEIDWVYGTGFPKNQDIGKLFDKKAGAEREVIGKRIHPTLKNQPNVKSKAYHVESLNSDENMESWDLTAPSTDQAKKWDGWKTAGLKPAHEPITVFQKPLEGTYINNINTYGVGAMNIDACRIPTSQEDEDKSMPANEIGRFPANMIFDSFMGEVLDGQSGSSKGNSKPRIEKSGDSTISKIGGLGIEGGRPVGFITQQYGDEGGASRYFLKIEEEDFVPFFYCAKASKKEKDAGLDNMPLQNNMRVNAPRNCEEDKYKTVVRNTHVTVKPKVLIKWLIKLVTPIDGKTIDITAGSGTHGLACEELNKNEGYSLKWVDVEMLNTEKEPYCDIAMNRIKNVI